MKTGTEETLFFFVACIYSLYICIQDGLCMTKYYKNRYKNFKLEFRLKKCDKV